MRPQMVSRAVALAFGALGLGVSAQQSAPQQPAATFRATTHLIVQTVTVKDKSGKPVLGLTAKDFVVIEDGQPQDIAFVEYEALVGRAIKPSQTEIAQNPRARSAVLRIAERTDAPLPANWPQAFEA